MAASKLMMVLVVMVIASFQLQYAVAQNRHVVGDADGWRVPGNGNGNYTTWASGKTFNVGDTLFFNFTTGAHDVTEVREAAYGPCNITNPISQITAGPATITLTSPGNHYYICTVGPHCTLGQKLTINVAGSSSPTPAPPGSTTPPPPPPPSPGSASSFTAVVPVSFLVAAVAFFY